MQKKRGETCVGGPSMCKNVRVRGEGVFFCYMTVLPQSRVESVFLLKIRENFIQDVGNDSGRGDSKSKRVTPKPKSIIVIDDYAPDRIFPHY